jgi:hypothetical protein
MCIQINLINLDFRLALALLHIIELFFSLVVAMIAVGV